MELKSLFKKPKETVLNLDKINFEKNEKALITAFAVCSRSTENGILLDEIGVIHNTITENINPLKVFSENRKLDFINEIIKESNVDGFSDLILGYYDHKKDVCIVEGFFKDFIRVDSLSLIDYYFTMKNQNTFYTKECFEKEMDSSFKEIVEKSRMSVSVAHFNNFLYKMKLSRNDFEKETIENMNLIIQELLKESFVELTDYKQQMQMTNLLSNIGVLDLRVSIDMKEFYNPKIQRIPGGNYKLFLVPNDRFLKVYN